MQTCNAQSSILLVECHATIADWNDCPFSKSALVTFPWTRHRRDIRVGLRPEALHARPRELKSQSAALTSPPTGHHSPVPSLGTFPPFCARSGLKISLQQHLHQAPERPYPSQSCSHHIIVLVGHHLHYSSSTAACVTSSFYQHTEPSRNESW